MAYEAAFLALADPTRRAVFERLRAGPRSAGRLAQGLPVSRPAVSQHLKVLREAGLVRVEARGTSRIYTMQPAAMAELRDYFDRMWDAALAAYKEAVDDGDGD